MYYDNDNYRMQIEFLVSRNIREYDISKANISILLALGYITKEQYDSFYNMSKVEREIKVGLLQRDNEEIRNGLQNGFAHYRKLFLETNNIDQKDVLGINKDAIFVINNTPQVTTFDNVVSFVNKNWYTSYFRLLPSLEFFYLLDNSNGVEIIDVKGIDDKKLVLHQDYMLQLFGIVFESIQSSSVESTLDIIIRFAQKYINRELDIGFYREFNADSKYRISMAGTQYYLDDVLSNEYQYINTYYNYTLIMELYKLVAGILMSTRR